MSTLSAMFNRPLALELGWRGAVRNYARLASVVVFPFIVLGVGVGLYLLLREDVTAVLATLTVANVVLLTGVLVALYRLRREAGILHRRRPEQSSAGLQMQKESALAEPIQRLSDDEDFDEERWYATERELVTEHAAIQALAEERINALIAENRRLHVDTPLIKISDLESSYAMLRSELDRHVLRAWMRRVEQYSEAMRETGRSATALWLEMAENLQEEGRPVKDEPRESSSVKSRG